MAKSNVNIFAKTEGDLDTGNIKSTGVGLREGEIAALETIGAELAQYLGADEPLKRNTITRLAIRIFLEDYQAGKITPEGLAEHFTRPEKPQPKLKS